MIDIWNVRHMNVFFKIYFISLLSALLVFSLFPLRVSAENYELYIAYGIQRINEGEINSALEFLEKAMRMVPKNNEASYYAGIAHAMAGDYKQAEDLFLMAIVIDESSENVYLELGRLYYVTSRCSKAEEFLLKFTGISENEALKEYATRLIDACREKAEKKPYKLILSAGGQYDSNVIIEPQSPNVSADRKADTRTTISLLSGVNLLTKGPLKLNADYNFYQNIHMQLNDFNVQYHKITPSLEIAVSSAFKFFLRYSLEYTLMGGEPYSRFHTSYGKVILKEGEKFSTEAIYEYRDSKYWNGSTYQANSIRSGYKNTMGIKQKFYFEGLSGSTYYFGDFETAEEGYRDYNGFRSGIELTFKITSPLYLSVTGEYSEKQYCDDYPVFKLRRLDRMQQYSLSLTYFFSDRLSASITESYTMNNSNLSIYDYNRDIAGIFLTAGIL